MKKNTLVSNALKPHTKTIIALIIAGALGTTLSANAQEAKAENATDTRIEDAWDLADLYENEQGDYLKLSGRLQLDSTWVNSKQGDYNDTSWRRFRFGFKGKQGEFKFTVEADLNLNNSLGDAYNRLTDANVSWSLDKKTALKFLKQSAGFTLDGKISSKKLLTPQRNNLTTNLWFTAEYFTGISIKSQLNNDWSYKVGIFSSDDSDEISISNASHFTLISTSKKLSKNTHWVEGEVDFDYVYNDTHADGNTRNFSQVISASSKFKKKNWGLHSDISWGKGDLGQSDLFGVVVMPTYQQNEKKQWVARYTYLNSPEDNGVRLGRYDSSVSGKRGDKYQEFYAGVNWFINDHKLKLQAGLQYAKMDDNANDGGAYNGFSFNVALRSYW